MGKVKLSKIIEALEMIDRESNAYFNTRTTEIVVISDEDFRLAEKDVNRDIYDWQVKTIELANEVMYSDTYISLPTKFDIFDYKIMKEYCYTLSSELSDICLYEITKKKSFANFRNFTNKYNLTDNFYNFKSLEYRKIAINWLEEKGLEYE